MYVYTESKTGVVPTQTWKRTESEQKKEKGIDSRKTMHILLLRVVLLDAGIWTCRTAFTVEFYPVLYFSPSLGLQPGSR